MDGNYNSRTAFSYITEKIRQNDTSSAVSIGTLDDVPSIILSQEVEGEIFHTYLYEYDGYLTELLTRPGLDLGGNLLKAGRPLIRLEQFELSEAGSSLYRFRLTTKDRKSLSLYISTQSDIREVDE